VKSQCVLFSSVNEVTVSSTELPEPAADELLMDVSFSCISPGTELRCLAGLQTGAPAFPFIPGYACSGIVAKAGAATKWKPGVRVFASGTRAASHARCWGGHCAHAIVRGEDAIAIPPMVDLRAASSAKLAAIAYHGLLLASPQPHESVVVVGLGPIGRFAAQLYHLGGSRVLVTDLNANRRDSARLGGLEVVDPSPGLLLAFGKALPCGADVVVDATGAKGALAETICLGKSPPWDHQIHEPTRFVMQGSYASAPLFPYDRAFERELHVLVPRDCRRADIAAVLDLMGRGLLHPLPWIAAIEQPGDAADFYQRLREDPNAPVCGTICWS
jgi:3-hydroxyethyl bacteriochlorophyllide a dehydrogenase